MFQISKVHTGVDVFCSKRYPHMLHIFFTSVCFMYSNFCVCYAYATHTVCYLYSYVMFILSVYVRHMLIPVKNCHLENTCTVYIYIYFLIFPSNPVIENFESMDQPCFITTRLLRLH